MHVLQSEHAQERGGRQAYAARQRIGRRIAGQAARCAEPVLAGTEGHHIRGVSLQLHAFGAHGVHVAFALRGHLKPLQARGPMAGIEFHQPHGLDLRRLKFDGNNQEGFAVLALPGTIEQAQPVAAASGFLLETGQDQSLAHLHGASLSERPGGYLR